MNELFFDEKIVRYEVKQHPEPILELRGNKC